MSPANSASDDSYSVISDAEALDPKPAESGADIPSQPVQQPDLSDEITRMIELNGALTLELSYTKVQRDEAFEKIDRMTELNGVLQLKLPQVKEERDEALEKVATQEAAKHAEDKATRKQLQALTKGEKDSIKDIPTLIAKYREALDNIGSSLSLIEAQMIEMRSRQKDNLEKSTEIKQLKAEKRNLELDLRSRDQEVTHLQCEMLCLKDSAQRRFTDQIAALKADVKDMEKDNADLKSELTACDQLTENLNATIDTLKEDMEALENKLEARDEEINELRSKASSLNATKPDLKEQFQARDEQIADLHAQVSFCKADQCSLEDRIADLNDYINILRDREESLEGRLADREDDVDEYEEKLHNARCRGRRLKKQRDGARAAKSG